MYYKRFPKETEGSTYPKWIEIRLTEEEEKQVEQQARQENKTLFKECVQDAQKIVSELELKGYQTDTISIAIALFDKRASHSVYHKENKAREKFEKI